MLTNGAYLPTAGEGLITYAGLYPPVAGCKRDEAGQFVTDFRNAKTSEERDESRAPSSSGSTTTTSRSRSVRRSCTWRVTRRSRV